MDESLKQFVALAIQNATRCALQSTEFAPRLDGLVIVVGSTGLLGARVFFEPPVKCVWVLPSGTAEYGMYETNRKQQMPFTATFYYIEDVSQLDQVQVYENGSPAML